MSIVRVSINAKLRPEKHFKMEHFSETEICIAKFSFHKTFVYSSFDIWLQFHQSTKNLSSFLRKFFHAFSALLIVFLSIFQWNRIDSNYHPSNAHEFENAPNKNADKSFVNDYQNAPHHVTSFFKKPSSTATKEKIIMVCFKKNHLTVEKVNLKSSNFVGFLVH